MRQSQEGTSRVRLARGVTQAGRKQRPRPLAWSSFVGTCQSKHCKNRPSPYHWRAHELSLSFDNESEALGGLEDLETLVSAHPRPGKHVKPHVAPFLRCKVPKVMEAFLCCILRAIVAPPLNPMLLS